MERPRNFIVLTPIIEQKSDFLIDFFLYIEHYYESTLFLAIIEEYSGTARLFAFNMFV